MTSRKSTAGGAPERALALLASLALALLGGASDAQGVPQALQGFEGRWERVGSDPEQERLSAIAAAIEELSWVMRGVAGPVLRRSTVPSDQYVFEVDAAGVRMGSHGRAPSPLALDGRLRRIEGERGAFEVSSEQLSDGIRTTWRSEQAHGSNTFEVADDGRHLVVRTTLTVTAISGVGPIAYVEHFRRSEDAPAAAPSPAD